MSLYLYGFVQDKNPPLLCAEDLPGFDTKQDYPFPTTPMADDYSERWGFGVLKQGIPFPETP